MTLYSGSSVTATASAVGTHRPLQKGAIPVLTTMRRRAEEYQDVFLSTMRRLLTRRVELNDWTYWTAQEIFNTEEQQASQSPTSSRLLEMQTQMGIKRTHVANKACATCHSEAAAGQTYQKCSTCLITYYCSRKCQKRDWAQHRLSCQAPEANVSNAWAVALPDHQLCRIYLQNAPAATMPLILTNAQVFAERFGTEAVSETLLSMARTGRPKPHLLNVTSRGNA